MREIKFRGKATREEYGRECEWVYGFYRNPPPCAFASISEWSDHGWNSVRVDPSTVGQYTGLKDVDGTEVYEGDLIEAPHDNGELCPVVFERGGFGFIIRYDQTFLSFDGLLDGQIKRIKAVGNIHDNPELMEAIK